VAPPELLHGGQPEVMLGAVAQPLLERADPAHAVTAGVGAGAGAAAAVPPPARSSARQFCAAIEIGSNSAPIGGE
jgi:hypothetical protein